MKYLWVGDPHVEPGDVADAKALIRLVGETARDHDVDAVILAGDLYHTHAIIHAEVQYFWWEALAELTRVTPAIVIKGNHDAPGNYDGNPTALVTHIQQPGVTVVAWEPWADAEGNLFCPYTSAKTLETWSAQYPTAPILFCHQDFYGSTYENGFQSGEGLNPNLIKQKRIISGHIHTPQEFGKVWYPGAPRWKTLSDANTDRAIWILETEQNIGLVRRTPVDTGTVCRKIYHFVDTEARPLSLVPVAGHDYRVDVEGTQAWINARKPLYQGWARIRTIRTDSVRTVSVKESEGVAVAFTKYATTYKAPHGTPGKKLLELAKERLDVL